MSYVLGLKGTTRKKERIAHREKFDEDLYDFLVKYFDKHGFPPTRREMLKELSAYPNYLNNSIKRLKEKKLIIQKKHLCRNIVTREQYANPLIHSIKD